MVGGLPLPYSLRIITVTPVTIDQGLTLFSSSPFTLLLIVQVHSLLFTILNHGDTLYYDDMSYSTSYGDDELPT